MAGFERARADSCGVSPDGTIEILIRPETQPVNNSAWYAFQLVSEARRSVQLVLRYEGGTHRYGPKLRTGDGAWSGLAASSIRIAPGRRTATLALDLPEGTTTVAAQPLETGAEALARWTSRVDRGQLTRTVFGHSVRGEPLVAFQTTNADARQTLVLVARQHPPETTGAAAFDAFAARLLEDDPLAVAFRARTRVLLIPVLNPDGLASGHWRTNANGVDLNRDWGIWSQPETKAAGELIEDVHRSAPLLGLIDFHSTRRDVLYAMPAEDPLYPPGLAEDWFARWALAAGPAAPPVQRRFDADQMNSKTWSRLRFGLSSVTYEVGDDTSPETATANARLSAEAYMGAVLARTPEQLLPPPGPGSG